MAWQLWQEVVVVVVLICGQTLAVSETTPPPRECSLFGESRIQAIPNKPHRTFDKFGCTECYCEEDYGDYDNKDISELPWALCLAIDCVAPRCVNFKRLSDQCCSVCPTGENCYKPVTQVNKNKCDNKSGKELRRCRRRRRKRLRKMRMEEEKYKKICDKNKKGKECRRWRRKQKRMRKMMREEEKNKNTNTTAREMMPARKDVVVGDRVCRCDDSEMDLGDEYNTEAKCHPQN